MKFSRIIMFSLYTLYGAPCDLLRRLPGVLEPPTGAVLLRSLLPEVTGSAQGHELFVEVPPGILGGFLSYSGGK